jgi:hypothetical protein
MDTDPQHPGIINAPEDITKRNFSVGARLNAEENQELEQLALSRRTTSGELIRALIREESERVSKPTAPSREFIEIIGLRLMLSNYLRPLSRGKVHTETEDKAILADIRQRKATLAREVFSGTKD